MLLGVDLVRLLNLYLKKLMLNLIILQFSLDIEEGDDIVDEFQIQSIPTLVYFKNGVQIDKTVGALSMDTIFK